MTFQFATAADLLRSRGSAATSRSPRQARTHAYLLSVIGTLPRFEG